MDIESIAVLEYIKEGEDFTSRILKTQALSPEQRVGLILAISRTMMERAAHIEPEFFIQATNKIENFFKHYGLSKT